MPKLHNLKSELEKFNRWLERHSSKKVGPQKMKQQAKKGALNAEELIVEEVGNLAMKAAKLFKNVIADVIQQKKPEEEFILDVKNKGEKILGQVDNALKNSKGVVGELRNVLSMLKDVLREGITKLVGMFKNIFSMPDLHQKQPKYMPAMAKHKGPPQHLKDEQKYKKQVPTHVEAHRKILTTKNK